MNMVTHVLSHQRADCLTAAAEGGIPVLQAGSAPQVPRGHHPPAGWPLEGGSHVRGCWGLRRSLMQLGGGAGAHGWPCATSKDVQRDGLFPWTVASREHPGTPACAGYLGAPKTTQMPQSLGSNRQLLCKNLAGVSTACSRAGA